MRFLSTVFIVFLTTVVFAQQYTREDSLRGSLNSLRSSYDVNFYNLSLVIDDKKQIIIDSYNEIYFKALQDFDQIQIDLAKNMQINRIEFEGNILNYQREYNAVFVFFSRSIKRGELSKIKVYYEGIPRVAVNPPWDGGFSWEKDSLGNPWVGVSCQGLGASSWWPCKDHQSDEPDSMRITCSVRHPLKIVSNGNLRSDTIIWNKELNTLVSKREWFVSYPINNYNVSINIGDYIHFSDLYITNQDTLSLDYYVLSYNLEKAKKHFQQVKPMLKCYENYFGSYPFWNDGFALVETPYLGMEHQSAIAYGNNYLQGYYGNTDFIAGLNFDFIIIHETGHEWWGNSITTNDIADMWIHEGFCTYAEVLYVECIYGYKTMLEFVNHQKNRIRNDKPIIGHYHVNKKGSGDMYNKGSLLLHTLRSLIENDSLWFSIIRGISDQFKHKTINGIDVINYINKESGYDFSDLFSQYLHHNDIPEFQYKFQKSGREYSLIYRWNAIDNFDMPILINNGNKDFWIQPTNNWKETTLGNLDIYDFRVREDLFLIDVREIVSQ
ncbi:MAG: M1 family metallopeptidase [Bacteroidota bacterium]|nr:M1 family metallopeptidase [Bacteroidota bacterium]